MQWLSKTTAATAAPLRPTSGLRSLALAVAAGVRRPRPRGAIVETLEPRLLLSAELGLGLDAPRDFLADADAATTGAALVALPAASSADLPPPANDDIDVYGDGVSESDAGAGAFDLADLAALADAAAQSPADPAREIVFVDTGVDNYAALVADIQAGSTGPVDVVLLNANADGVSQIGETLATASDLAAVHVISHGSAGGVQLGNTWLTATSLAAYGDALAGWRIAFAADGDLLFYGCDLAASDAGRGLVDSLAAITGADVAASDDLTGHASLGGDWELEYAAGTIETGIIVGEASRAAFTSVLADIAYDGFDYAAAAGGLNNQGGGSGWSGSWLSVGNDTDTIATNLADPGATLATDGGAVQISTGFNQTVIQSRDMATSIGADGTTAWFSFLVQPDDGFGVDYAGIRIGTSTAFIGHLGGNYTMTDAGGGNRVDSATAAMDGVTALLVVKAEFNAGPDTLSLYVNPTPGADSPDTPAVVKTNLDLGSFNRIEITGGDTVGLNSSILDEIRVGTTFADVAPVTGQELVLNLATDGDVTGGGQAGTDTWTHGDLVAVTDPNLDLGPGTTAGTFGIAVAGNAFFTDLDLAGAHLVSRNVQVGDFQLFAGDLLFATDTNETFVSNNLAPLESGFAASVAANREDLLVFRPDSAGDYATGGFALLVGDMPGDGSDIRAVTLVEKTTTIGGTTVQAGDFLFARSGSVESDVYWYQTGTTGAAAAPDGIALLVAGDDAGVGIAEKIQGLDLLEEAATIGGRTLTAGTLLVNVDSAEPVGSNALNVDEFDVFAFSVAQSTLAAGSNNGVAAAAMLFDGSQVAFNDNEEALDAIALTPAAGIFSGHFLDRFDTGGSYAGNDGSLTWSNDWQEVGEANGAGTGDVQVRDFFAGDGGGNTELWTQVNKGVWREADLSGAGSATLSFDYVRGGLEADDHLVVYAQTGGGTGGVVVADAPGTWDEIGRFSGAADDAAYLGTSIDLGSWIAADTRILFFAENSAQGNDEIFVDNVRIDLAAAASNLAPTADAGGPYAIAEGVSLALDGSSSSDIDGTIVSWEWDIGDDGSFEKSGSSVSFDWGELVAAGIVDDGIYDVTLRVTDDQGATSTEVLQVTVDNVAPTLGATGATNVTAGTTYTLTLTAADPGDDTISRYFVNWGDGTVTEEAFSGPSTDVTHVYADSGFTYHVTFAAEDEDGTWTNSDLVVGSYVFGQDDIFRFDGTTGAFDSLFESSGGAVDQPYVPVLGPDGNIYLGGAFTDRIVRYDTDGNYLGEFVGPGVLEPGVALDVPNYGMAWGADGNLYVSNYNDDNILRFDSDGNYIDEFGTAGGLLNGPAGLAFGPDGDLYVASWLNGRILKFDGAAGGTPTTVISSGLSNPDQILFDSAGDLFIGNSSNNVVSLWDGSTLSTYLSDPLLDRATGIAFGPDGKLYVSSFDDDRILRYDDATTTLEVFVAPGSGGLDQPGGLLFTSEHRVTVDAVSNVAPVADPGGPYTIAEGGTLALDGSASSDADGSVVDWEWDIGDDGSFEKSGGSVSFDWGELNALLVNDDGTFDAALRVTDDGGEQHVQAFQFSVDNVAPTLTGFGGAVATTAEETEVEITFGTLAASGDENDVVDAVDAFVVNNVTSGTLRIGTDSGSATLYAAGTNEIVDATLKAYWSPDTDDTGAALTAFTVVARDDDGAESAAPTAVTVDVTPVPDPAVVAGVNTGAVTEDIDPDIDGLLETGAALSVTDPDTGEASFVAETVTGSYGSLTINAAGAWTYEADNTQASIQGLGAGDALTDTLTVRTADGTTHDVVITIDGAEDAAAVAGTFTGAVTEGNVGDTPVTATGTLSISDADDDDSPSFADVTATAGDNAYGSFALTAGSWTFTLDQAAVQNLDAGDSASDQLTFTASNGTTRNVTVSIAGSNDQPGATNLFQVKQFIEDGPPIAFDPIVVSDVDSAEQIDATLTLADSDAGALTTPAGASYDAGTGAWTITGTVAEVNAALAAVSFVPEPDYRLPTSIDVRIEDGGEDGATPVLGTIDLDAVSVNDAPNAVPGGPYVVDEDGTVQLDGRASSDPDGDIIRYEWDFDYDGVTFDIDASGSQPTFDAAGLEGPDSQTVALRVTDDGAGVAITRGNTFVSTIGKTPEGFDVAWFARARNFDSDVGFELGVGTEPPLAWGGTGQHGWGGSGTTSTFTLSYDDATGTARIDVGASSTQFVINDPFTDLYLQVRGSGVGNALEVGNIALDLGGGDVLDGIATPIRASGDAGPEIKYLAIHNLAGYLSDGFTLTAEVLPTFGGALGDEQLAFDVLLANDPGFVPSAGTRSDIVTTTLDIVEINDQPAATNLVQTQAFVEDGPAVPLAPIVVSDSDAGEQLTATLTLVDPAAGSLSTTSGGSYAGATGTWTATGTVAGVNAALATVAFTPAAGYTLDTSILVDIRDGVEDGAVTLSGNISLDGSAVNEQPAATNVDQTKSYVEGAAAVTLDPIVVSDADAGEIVTANLTLQEPTAGILTTSGSASYSPASGVWAVTGTVADVNAALAAVTFVPAADNDLDTSITVAVVDGGEDGAVAVTGTIDLVVTAVNNQPSATNLAQNQSYLEDTAFESLNNIVVTDVDSGEIVTAVLTLTDPAAGSLTTSGTAGYSAASGIWTVTGTVAAVNDALRNVEFAPAPGYAQDSSITVTITDGGENGTTAITGTITLDATPVGDTPVVGSTTTAKNTPTTLLVIARNPGDGAEVTHFRISAITNGSVTLADGVTPVVDGQFITFAQGQAGLRFVPLADSLAEGRFAVAASEDGLTVAAQSGTAVARIAVFDPGPPPPPPAPEPAAADTPDELEQLRAAEDAQAFIAQEIRDSRAPADKVEPDQPGNAAEPAADAADDDDSTDDSATTPADSFSDEELAAAAQSFGLTIAAAANLGAENSEFGPAAVTSETGETQPDDDDGMSAGPGEVSRGGFSFDPRLVLGESLLRADLQALDGMVGADDRPRILAALTSDPVYLEELDQMRENIDEVTALNQVFIGSTVALSSGISVGYVVWLARGGLLLASMLSSMPAWRLVDPLPILASLADQSDGGGDSLASMLEQHRDDPANTPTGVADTARGNS